MLKCHTIAFFVGFILDLLFGDPHGLPHPVRLIGWLVLKLEGMLYKGKYLALKGGILAVLTVALAGVASCVVLAGAYSIHWLAGLLVESLMTYQILAVKSLKTESMKVYERIVGGTLREAREAVSMIVGRDTACLDEAGVIKAAVETVAENTSDGVVAPMLYLAAGGPVLGFMYKAVNTMDSMVGYKNERYFDFGRAAAKLDDAVNYIPSRAAACLMIAAAYCGGSDLDGREARRIYKRDRRKHKSPNAAQTESVCAGALGIRLAGDARYFGKVVKKPYIGDDTRGAEAEDIRRANRLMYLTAGLCEGICILILVNSLRL